MPDKILLQFRSLPAIAQVLLALLAIGLSVALSPLVAILALLGLIFGVLALGLGAIQNRPLRRRGMLAAASLLLLVVFLGISNALYGPGTPEQASTPEPREATAKEDPRDEEAGEETISKAAVESMRATYYGEEFAGAPTASGELYDPNGFTAAHPYLPFGTRLLVSHDSRSAIVTVNDRLPQGSDYDIDLSLAAAQGLGFAGVGSTVVDAEVLEP